MSLLSHIQFCFSLPPNHFKGAVRYFCVFKFEPFCCLRKTFYSFQMRTSALCVCTIAATPLTLYSFKTASLQWWPFRWYIRVVVIKPDVCFPPLGILAEDAKSNRTVLRCHREQTSKVVHRWRCNERNTVFKALEKWMNLSLINLANTLCLILLFVIVIFTWYKIILFIYRSNKNYRIFTHITRSFIL